MMICVTKSEMCYNLPGLLASFLAQLSRCAYTITFHKPYIAGLEIWTIGLWTVGPFVDNSDE